jgi:hypothetical protein
MNKSWTRGFEMNNKLIEECSLEYIDFIREKACCVSGKSVADPHHLIAIGMGQNRKNPSAKHFTCIPLSREMHTELHKMGTQAFEIKYNISLWQEAYYLFISFLVLKEIIE